MWAKKTDSLLLGIKLISFLYRILISHDSHIPWIKMKTAWTNEMKNFHYICVEQKMNSASASSFLQDIHIFFLNWDSCFQTTPITTDSKRNSTVRLHRDLIDIRLQNESCCVDLHLLFVTFYAAHSVSEFGYAQEKSSNTLLKMSLKFYFITIMLNNMIKLTQGNAGHVIFSVTNGEKYQCGNQSCSWFYNAATFNVRQCQLTCMDNRACSIMTFQQSLKQCQLYYSTVQLNGLLTADSDAITMTVSIDNRYQPGKALSRSIWRTCCSNCEVDVKMIFIEIQQQTLLLYFSTLLYDMRTLPQRGSWSDVQGVCIVITRTHKLKHAENYCNLCISFCRSSMVSN